MAYDDRLEDAVELAAEAVRNGYDFYTAVQEAADRYDMDWSEVQHGMAMRSALIRSRRAVWDRLKQEEAERRVNPEPEPEPEPGARQIELIPHEPDNIGAIRR